MMTSPAGFFANATNNKADEKSSNQQCLYVRNLLNESCLPSQCASVPSSIDATDAIDCSDPVTASTTSLKNNKHKSMGFFQNVSTSTTDIRSDTGILREISSYLSLSDVASIASITSFAVDDNINNYRVNNAEEIFDNNSTDCNGGGCAMVATMAVSSTVAHAASLATSTPQTCDAMPLADDDPVLTSEDSWAMSVYDESDLFSCGGVKFGGSIRTPSTPALIVISPGVTPPSIDCSNLTTDFCDVNNNLSPKKFDNVDDGTEGNIRTLLHEHRRERAQKCLAKAVFSHPKPLRSYCTDAYNAAKEIKERNESREKQHRQKSVENEYSSHKKSLQSKKMAVIQSLLDSIFHNVPLSILFDVFIGACDTSFETIHSLFELSLTSMKILISSLSDMIRAIVQGVTNFNPVALINAIISLQFNAMGKTSEVIVSGIQSVATSVSSASSIALHRLSLQGGGGATIVSTNLTGISSSSSHHLHLHHLCSTPPNALIEKNKKFMKKVSSMNAAAEVISYTEVKDDTGGLSRHAKNRVQRMMHYDVSLRPFVATIVMPPTSGNTDKYNCGVDSDTFAKTTNNDRRKKCHDRPNSTSSNCDHTVSNNDNKIVERSVSPENMSPLGVTGSKSAVKEDSQNSKSPFMCTPQSFPPTPVSRRMVLARGSRFADDVVFLARDQLRVHHALESTDERTREMAHAQRQGKLLAVFDAKDNRNGIELACGQHIATKVGNMLYCSTRSMVPILRNCFVYFEMSVMSRVGIGHPPGTVSAMQTVSMAMLSIGLSTGEMPPNVLVGTWEGSVGLCTTGQMLTAGQWCTPADARESSYSNGAIVGCLVCLDDGSAFETWDGVMVTAAITFNVNGRVVSPPIGAPLFSSNFADMTTATDNAHTEPICTNNGYTIRAASPMPITMPLLVPAAEELFPTVTLHSPSSAVMCRFSAEDIVARSKSSIGAPNDLPVYAVDGSVIFLPDN